jgi:hypothetical protein
MPYDPSHCVRCSETALRRLALSEMAASCIHHSVPQSMSGSFYCRPACSPIAFVLEACCFGAKTPLVRGTQLPAQLGPFATCLSLFSVLFSPLDIAPALPSLKQSSTVRTGPDVQLPLRNLEYRRCWMACAAESARNLLALIHWDLGTSSHFPIIILFSHYLSSVTLALRMSTICVCVSVIACLLRRDSHVCQHTMDLALRRQLESQFDSIQFGRRPCLLASLSHKNATMKQSRAPKICSFQTNNAPLANVYRSQRHRCCVVNGKLLHLPEKRVSLQSPTRPCTALCVSTPHMAATQIRRRFSHTYY